MRRKKILAWVGIILLGGWAAVSLFLAIRNTFTPLGGNDLFTYWYAGLFIRQGENPYAAFLARQQPALPITFLDGEAHSLGEVKIAGLVPAPANTYPMIYLLTLFSFLSWQTAKATWLVCNLALVLLIPVLLVRLIAEQQKLDGLVKMALFLTFIGFTSTRYALSSGQLSFLVFGMMLGSALLIKRHPWIAGILMGLAISKYSLCLGFFLYYLIFERRLRMSLVTLLIQAGGVLLLSWTSNSSILEVLQGYRILFEHHARMEGIQLSALLAVGGSNPPLSTGFTLLVGGCLVWYVRKNPVSRQVDPLVRLSLLTVLLLWSLLVGYHRAYDALTFILCLGLAACLVGRFATQPQTRGLSIIWKIFAFLAAGVMLLPAGSLVRAGLPEAMGPLWITLVSKLTSVILLLALVLCLYTLLTGLGGRHWQASSLVAGESNG